MDFKLNIRIVKSVWLSLRKFVWFFVPISGLFLVPMIIQACSWYDLMCKLSPQDVSAQSETVVQTDLQNSQNMSLPEPANNIDPSIKIIPPIVTEGGALLPETGPSTDAPDQIDTSSDQISTYTVRSGDTLSKVATMFGVSVNTILWANDLARGTPLQAGQNLVILPVSGVIHTVVSGDTLQSVAKKYNGDAGDIASFNGMAVTDKLVIGDVIIIPDGEASYSVSNSPSAGNNTRGRIYEPLLVNVRNLPVYDGYFMKPFIAGTKTQGLHGHNAVDYGMPTGSPLYATAAGTVIISKSSGWNGGYGKYVAIQHPNGTETVYGHMSNPAVSVGQTVTQGQLIGYSGNTGNSTGPHLHFEIRGAKNPF